MKLHLKSHCWHFYALTTQFASVLHGTFIGPILGCATLGMFFPWSNWIGILMGLVPSVALTLFIGVGSILAGNDSKLPNQKLPFGNDGCYLNGTLTTEAAATTLARFTTTSSNWKDQEYSSIINVLSLSYMWQGIVPVFCTIIFGLIFSLIVRRFRKFPKFSSAFMSQPILKLWIFLRGRDNLRHLIEFEDENVKKPSVVVDDEIQQNQNGKKNSLYIDVINSFDKVEGNGI